MGESWRVKELLRTGVRMVLFPALGSLESGWSCLCGDEVKVTWLLLVLGLFFAT